MSNSTGLTGLLPEPHGNATLIENPDLCTLALCDLTLGQLDYIPSLGGNALFAAIFGVGIFLQLLLFFKYRTWGFTIAVICGLIVEVIGYVGRIMLHSNPFSNNDFIIYIVTLTIAPAFLSAAIYLCLARIVVLYGEEKSRFRPRTYTILFCSFDFLALVLQAAGGAVASIANDHPTVQIGIDVMLAGLSVQVFSLFFFITACSEFAYRVYTNSSHKSNRPSQSQYQNAPSLSSASPMGTTSTALPATTQSRIFKIFLCTLGIATLAILIRSIFRVAELSGGFNGKLANDQVSFMILEGAMISITVIALTFGHPGFSFGKEGWGAVNFRLRKGNRGNASGKEMGASDEEVQMENMGTGRG